MKKSEYNQKRSLMILIFGIFMTVNSTLLLIFAPLQLLHEKNHATAYVTGEVVSTEGEDVKIYYSLPGQDGGWLVTKHGTGWEQGDEVNVFYNPDDLSEKYIEGFEENPWDYVFLAVPGLVLGLCALLVHKASKKSVVVNDVLDRVD